LATFLVMVCLFGVVSVNTLPNSLLHVFALDFLEALPVIVKALESLKLAEKLALLDHNHVAFLSS